MTIDVKRIFLILTSACLLACVGRTAGATIRFGGEAALRIRGEFRQSGIGDTEDREDDLKYQYRFRLRTDAELGDGYFFNAQLQYEDGASGVWQTVRHQSSERYKLQLSSFVMGRKLGRSRYTVGRLPLDGFRNPLYDLGLYPSQPLEIPIVTMNCNRFFGASYTGALGSESLGASLLLIDNGLAGNISNPAYTLHVTLKSSLGPVTVEPQVLAMLGGTDIYDQDELVFKKDVTPLTAGVTLTFPLGGAEIDLCGFYTMADEKPSASSPAVDYSGYLLRLRTEKGPFMAWIDYSRTIDRSAGLPKTRYANTFVWAQYRIPVYESPSGTFTLTPTLRYLASSLLYGSTDTEYSRLRTELVATVTF